MLPVIESYVRRLCLEIPDVVDPVAVVPVVLTGDDPGPRLLALAAAADRGSVCVSVSAGAGLRVRNDGPVPVLGVSRQLVPATDEAGNPCSVILEQSDVFLPGEERGTRGRVVTPGERAIFEDAASPVFLRRSPGAPPIAIASFRAAGGLMSLGTDQEAFEHAAETGEMELQALASDSPAARPRPGQCGAAILIHGFFAGADCLAVPDLYEDSGRGMVDRRLRGASDLPLPRSAHPERPLAVVRGVFNRLRYADVRLAEDRDPVRRLHFETEEIFGEALTLNDRVVVLNVTPRFLIA